MYLDYQRIGVVQATRTYPPCTSGSYSMGFLADLKRSNGKTNPLLGGGMRKINKFARAQPADDAALSIDVQEGR